MKKPFDFESMPVERLWSLHEKITAILIAKIKSEKSALEKRLTILDQGLKRKPAKSAAPKAKAKPSSGRRPYPRVLSKYRNPSDRSETWSGRGLKPRWLTAQLEAGKAIEEFRI